MTGLEAIPTVAQKIAELIGLVKDTKFASKAAEIQHLFQIISADSYQVHQAVLQCERERTRLEREHAKAEAYFETEIARMKAAQMEEVANLKREHAEAIAALQPKAEDQLSEAEEKILLFISHNPGVTDRHIAACIGSQSILVGETYRANLFKRGHLRHHRGGWGDTEVGYKCSPEGGQYLMRRGLIQ